MKTALQQLIEKIDFNFPRGDNSTADFIKGCATRLLETEKDIIIHAVWYGNAKAAVEDKRALGKKYYTTTFNSETNSK